MAKIRGNGRLVQPFRGSLLPRGFKRAAVLLLLATSCVQGQNPPTSNSIGKNKPSPAVSAVPAQEVAPLPVVPPPPPPTVEQKPPQPPTVAWDGKLLTIDADNSTLATILVAVRERTGASIEIPGAASGERVFVHLGPGPARDILSDLLYGTSFDYVVETAEDDPDTLRKIVLTARGQGDVTPDVVVAGTTVTGEGSGAGGAALAADARGRGATDGASRSERVRMMPGWSSSGKPTFQANAEAALAAAQAAAQDSTAASEGAAAPDGAPAPEVTAASDGAAAADSAVSQDAVAPKDPAVAQDSAAGVDVAESTKASNSSASKSDTDDPTGAAIHSMTKMFEQRRQIQAQQNQPPPPSN